MPGWSSKVKTRFRFNQAAIIEINEYVAQNIIETNMQKTGLKPVFFYFKSFLNRFIASTVFSFEPNEVNLKYPSPFLPNPAPGVPTTCILFKR